MERSLNDALCVIIDVIKENKIVAGGGAIEGELSKKLHQYAIKVGGREQLTIEALANALETITTSLAENADQGPIDMLVNLRAAHEKRAGLWKGVNVITGEITDMMKDGVLEPMNIKEQAIKSAVEAASMILRIDDIVAVAKAPPTPPTPAGSSYGGMPPY